MGTAAMKTASVAVALCAILVATYAITEVQELGNDDSAKSLAASEEANNEEIGEGAGVGRRASASFLMTSGSFTLSAGMGNRAGNDEEDDEDELGEGAGVGRRASASFLRHLGRLLCRLAWGIVLGTTKRKTRSKSDLMRHTIRKRCLPIAKYTTLAVISGGFGMREGVLSSNLIQVYLRSCCW